MYSQLNRSCREAGLLSAVLELLVAVKGGNILMGRKR